MSENPYVKQLKEQEATIKQLQEEMKSLKASSETHQHEHKEPEKPADKPKDENPAFADLAAALRHADSCPDCGKVADEYVRKKIKENYGLEPDMECAGCGEKVFKTQPKCLKCGGTRAK